MPVAYYRCEVKTISRSKGHAATAAAAYRSGGKLYDTRTGLTHDYRRKQGVEFSTVIAPAEAAWITSREELWNRAEQAETRGNARVAREVLVCFPCQLERDERITVAQQFSRWLAAEYGVAVDLSLHRPERGNDDRNYHAHLLLTTRQVTAEGLGKKTRILDDKKQGPEQVKRIRKAWADVLNQQLARSGREERVDHRSNVEQGIDRIPQVHLGKAVIAMESRGISTALMDRFKQIAATNDNCAHLKEQIAELERQLQREIRKEKAQKVRRQNRTNTRRRLQKGRGRPQRLAQGKRNTRYGTKALRKSGYSLTKETRQQAVEAFTEAYLTSYAEGNRGAVKLDWQATKKLATKGFNPLAIKYALQHTSLHLQDRPRRQGDARPYVHKTVNAIMHLPEVQKARRLRRDSRALIQQFRQFYDRERRKPLSEAHLLKRHENRLRQVFLRLGKIEKHSANPTKSMPLPLGPFISWAVTAVRSARSAKAVYKTVKQTRELAKRQNDKKLEQQKVDPQKTQTSQQKASASAKTQDKTNPALSKSVTADKKSPLQKASEVTKEVQAISAGRNGIAPKPGGSGGRNNRATEQQGRDPAQEPPQQDPSRQEAITKGMAYDISEAKVKEIVEQVKEDNIQPLDLNYEQQYSVLRDNLENFDAEQVTDPESDVGITEKMIKVGQFRAEEEQLPQQHKEQIINALTERSPHAAGSEDALSYADNTFSEALGRVEAQNFKPDKSVYEVFDAQYHTQQQQRTFEAMQMLNDGPELGD